MKTFNFRIFKNIYFEKGEETQSYYYIEEEYKFLGLIFWITLKQPNYGGETTVQFKTEKLAHDYVKKYVNKNTVEGWEETKTMEFYCFPQK